MKGFVKPRDGEFTCDIVPDDNEELIHIQHMPVDVDDDEDESDSVYREDWSESDEEESETTSDEQGESSSNDERPRLRNFPDHCDERHCAITRHFMELIGYTVEQSCGHSSHHGGGNVNDSGITQEIPINDAEACNTDDIMDWTTTSDDNVLQRRHSWPLMQSSQAVANSQLSPIRNMMSSRSRIATSTNSFRNIRSQAHQPRRHSQLSFPDRRWSFSHSS